jgi:hypothetical protein
VKTRKAIHSHPRDVVEMKDAFEGGKDEKKGKKL